MNRVVGLGKVPSHAPSSLGAQQIRPHEDIALQILLADRVLVPPQETDQVREAQLPAAPAPAAAAAATDTGVRHVGTTWEVLQDAQAGCGTHLDGTKIRRMIRTVECRVSCSSDSLLGA